MEIITCDPSIYIINHPELIASYQMEDPINIQRVNEDTISSIVSWSHKISRYIQYEGHLESS